MNELLRRYKNSLGWARHLGLLLLLFIALCPAYTFAATTDSVKTKNSVNDTWYYWGKPEQYNQIDTSIVNLEEYNQMQRPGSEYYNLGNAGSAAFPLVFTPLADKDFNAGFNQFNAYRFSLDSIRVFRAQRPYTQLSYVIGQATEQMFNGKFAAQSKQRLFYGVDFTRINSKGTYTNQSTNDNGFSLYGIYRPKSNVVEVKSTLLFNNFRAKENGGLTLDIFNNDTALFTKALAPTRLTNAVNEYQSIDWFAYASYNFGKKKTITQDTLTYKQTVPTFSAGYRLNIGRNKYNYVDSKPDSLYYQDFYINADSLKNSLSYIKIGNEAQFDFHGQFLKDDTTIRYINMVANVALGTDYIMMSQNSLKSGFANTYVRGEIRNNTNVRLPIIYSGEFKYYMSGYNRNDLHLGGWFGYDFGKFGLLTGHVKYSLTEAPFIYQEFKSHGTEWNPAFPKQSLLSFGGKYVNNKIGVFADATYTLANNYFYFSGPNTPAYDGRNSSILVVHGGNRFAWKGLHIDNDVWFQVASNNDVIRLPMVVTRHSIFYERRYFKKALWMGFGFDLRYNTEFNSNAYFPLTGQFYVQDAQQLKYYPVLDAFINLKIKWARIFLKVENISSKLGPKGYYTSYLYPAQDIAFKGGVRWRFFE